MSLSYDAGVKRHTDNENTDNWLMKQSRENQLLIHNNKTLHKVRGKQQRYSTDGLGWMSLDCFQEDSLSEIDKVKLVVRGI